MNKFTNQIDSTTLGISKFSKMSPTKMWKILNMAEILDTDAKLLRRCNSAEDNMLETIYNVDPVENSRECITIIDECPET